MTGSDRPTQNDPDGNWPGDDPEVTRVVRNPVPAAPEETSGSGRTGTADTPSGDAPAPHASAPDAPASDGPAAGAWPSARQSDGTSDVGPWTAASVPAASDANTGDDQPPASSAVTGPNVPVTGRPHSGPAGQPPSGSAPYSARSTPPGDQPTQYTQSAGGGAPSGYGAPPSYQPTSVIPAAGGYQGGYSSGYSGTAAPTEQLSPDQRAGYQGEYRSGPQIIQAPGATAVVLPPPVKLPNAESRMAINAFGTLIGILLVAGGLVLLLRFAPQLRAADGSINVLSTVWTMLGALLIAVAALLAAWASWAALVPGVIVAGVSIWAMVTPPSGGMNYITKATRWAVGEQLAAAAASGIGLTIGLLLFFAGLAAVLIRSTVRRTVRQQLATMQS